MIFEQELQETAQRLTAAKFLYYAERRPIYASALDLYLSGTWRELYNSWEDCMTDTLTGHLDEDGVYSVVDCVPILARLKVHPVFANGIKIDHTTFLDGLDAGMDDIHYLLMHIWRLDLETAWGNHQFEECVRALFTMDGRELDRFLENIAEAKAPSFWKVRALWSKARRFLEVRGCRLRCNDSRSC